MEQERGGGPTTGAGPPEDVLDRFSPVTSAWFRASFARPTPAQQGAWRSISAGSHTLVVAATGSGKTLSAFLWAIDDLVTHPDPGDDGRRCRVVYVSPLKALASDVERNLRAPLTGIGQQAALAGSTVRLPSVASRSGDTPAAARRDFARHSAEILITTPESLYLLLTSAAREQLRGVRTVIIDEIHAVAATKRGAHLAVSLERLAALTDVPVQRIGLSATVRPVDEVARFLGGAGRAVQVVQPPSDKVLDLQVVVPVPDLGDLAGDADGEATPASIWPHVEERVVDLVAPRPAEAARSSLVFTNSRRLAERLTARLNEVWADRTAEPNDDPPVASTTPAASMPAQVMAQAGVAVGAPPLLARAHHGSVSKEQRALIEDDLKSGRLPAVVATSSLELGIDMGAIDLVVQVESPPSVASGLQRVGRAGHQVGAVSRGVLFPKFRGDLVSSAVVAERMLSGEIEALTVPANPLDVLAQQIVAMVAMHDWTVDEVHDLARRSAPFATLTRPVLESVLDMLAGRYPSEEFAELRPRLVWDRLTGVLSARAGAQRLAVTSGGTIPDRGLFGVFLAGDNDPRRGGRRVGELDEEMVYESRVGDTFTLGASTWQIVDITHDQVLVVPAPGRPGKLPFWHGDQPGRPYELGVAIGRFTRELDEAGPDAARARLTAAGLDEWAADNLLGYLAEQRAAVPTLPDDRTVVVERFRDELGDWRVVIHSPFGLRVHSPWALALGGRLRAEHGVDVQAMPADDGIVLRLPDIDDDGFGSDNSRYSAGVFGERRGGGGSADEAGLATQVVLAADDIADRVGELLGGSALFAARFRECAARALLLPRRRPDRRSPLWQQRQRAGQLLEVAAGYPTFPILLETVRECLQDVFDVPALRSVLAGLGSGAIKLVEVTTEQPSPFARSLLFGYVAQFLYEGDAPLAERRAAALSLDPDLLAELLGTQDTTRLADLLDPQAVLTTHRQLQRLEPNLAARHGDDIADLLRVLGPLTVEGVRRRSSDIDVDGILRQLVGARRVIEVVIGGRVLVAAAEDAGRLRDGLGTPLPVGLPTAFTEIVDDPLTGLAVRYARTHVPFTASALAARFGIGVAVARQVLERLLSSGRLARGHLLPPTLARADLSDDPDTADDPGDPSQEPGAALHYCHPDVLRTLRRRSLAALRAEVEPVPTRELARFLPGWQEVGGRLRGVDGVLRVVEQLAGVAVPASALESLVLPARVRDYSPALLDELMISGEVLWSGCGRLPGEDGWVALHPADTVELTLRREPATDASRAVHDAIAAALATGAGFFARQLGDAVRAGLAPVTVTDDEIARAVWDLVWEGRVSGDTMSPLRSRLGGGRTAHRRRATPARGRYSRRATGAALAAASRARVGGDLGGRWFALPEPATGTTQIAAGVEVLLDRYGVLTRGSVTAESFPGGFAAAYRVLVAMEEAGRVRRGYFVEGLGASQFATSAAVDRLRGGAAPVAGAGSEGWQPSGSTAGASAPGIKGEPGHVVVLAACDPANPFGASLAWPATEGTHRPARRAGALVVLAGPDLVVYAERGARTMLTFTSDPSLLAEAARALAATVRTGALSALTVTSVDGHPLLGSDHPWVAALVAAGFHATPRGLRLRR